MSDNNFTMSTTSSTSGGSEVVSYEQGVTTVEYALIGSALTIVATVGTIFNGFAIAVFSKYRELRSPTNSFVFALCVCDFFMSFVGAPIPAYYAFSNTYIKSQTLCSIDAFTVYFLACTSIYLLAAISVDRYIIIVKPVASLIITQKIATLAISLCFILGFFWSLMPLIGWNGYSLEGIGVACSVTWSRRDVKYNSFIIALFLVCFLAPLLVMVFSYLSIVFTVRKIFRGAVMKNLKKHYLIECQMIKTVIIMIALFAGSWLPYAIVSFSVAFGSPFNISRLVETIPALIAKSCSMWNPIVYVAMNRQFRAGFLSLLPFLKKTFPGESSKDEYDMGDNQASKDGDEAKPSGSDRTNKERAGEIKYDSSKLGLSTAGTSLYTGKVSSTTSFISADWEKQSNRCPIEVPMISKAVSEYNFAANDSTRDQNQLAGRRASDSDGVKRPLQSNHCSEDRFKKKNILTKLKRSKVQVSKTEQTNKLCLDAESSSIYMSVSDATLQSGTNLKDQTLECPNVTGTNRSRHGDKSAWCDDTRMVSQSDSIVQPSETLRSNSIIEKVALFSDDDIVTEC